MSVVAEEVDQQVTDGVGLDQRVLLGTMWLPPTRIVFVPFTLVEVELLTDDE